MPAHPSPAAAGAEVELMRMLDEPRRQRRLNTLGLRERNAQVLHGEHSNEYAEASEAHADAQAAYRAVCEEAEAARAAGGAAGA